MDLSHWTIGWEEIAAGAIFVLIWIAFLRLAFRYRKAGPSRRNNRYDHRFKSAYRGWLGFAGERYPLRGLDLTSSGALIATSRRVLIGSDVFVYLTTAGLMGWAKVRHCSRAGLFRYQIGLEFRSPLMPTQQGNWQYMSARV
jgi:hypothetical protein